MKNLKLLFGIGLFAAAFSLPASGATYTGGDWAGGNLVVADGDILSGNFYNVGSFTVLPGATGWVADGSAFELHANSVLIDGILNANGAGYAGAPGPIGSGANGAAGAGLGAGQGGGFGTNVHASGGGGGAFGGAGGNSGQSLGNPSYAPGGAPYGNANDAVALMGSGGGSAGNHGGGYLGLGGAGGDGGGSVSIFAFSFLLNGAILANGGNGLQGSAADWSTSGGGGGAGGGISITSLLAVINGDLSATGGDGANFMPGANQNGFGQGGGGGGGGRIYVNTATYSLGAEADFFVDGGAAGASDFWNAVQATSGEAGSLLILGQEIGQENPVPEVHHYASALGFALVGIHALRRRKA